MRLEQPADALDDDARLARAGARDDDDRPVAILDDRALLVGERELLALGGSRRRYGDRGSLLTEMMRAPVNW